MKKILVIVTVALATTFCACTNSSTSTNSNEDTLTAEAADAIVDEDLSQLLDEIAGDVEAQDADALQSSVEAFKARIQALINAGNVSVAQKYLESLKGYLVTNKEQVEAISATVAESAETTVESLVQKVANLPSDVAKTAQDAAEDIANAAVNKANETVELLKKLLMQPRRKQKQKLKKLWKHRSRKQAKPLMHSSKRQTTLSTRLPMM